MQNNNDLDFLEYKQRKRFANLDGLRFICISMVLWHHAQPERFESLLFLDRGFLGVDFFFVLSGYLITTLLLREAENYGHFSLKKFYLRRILRIVPIYFFVVSAVSSYYVLIKGRSELAEIMPYYYFFLSNFLTEHIPLLTITWSLSVEEQYYLLWPFILFILPFRYYLPVCIALIILNVIGIMGFFGDLSLPIGALILKLPNSTYAPILIGSALSILLNKKSSFDLFYTLLSYRWAASIGMIILVCLLQFSPDDVRGLPNLAIHTTMALILACLVLTEKNSMQWFLQHPLIARIGVVSYGIYLYHLIALDITNRLFNIAGLNNSWLLLVCYSIVAYFIAELSYQTLEAYFRKLRPR